MSWEKRSFRENNLEINMSFNIAAEELNIERDYLIGLTVYKSTSNGIAYKIAFINTKGAKNEVHIYTVSGSEPNDLKVTNKETKKCNGELAKTDAKYIQGNDELTKFYKDTDTAIQSVDKAEFVEIEDNTVLIFYVKTNGGDKVRIAVIDNKANQCEIPDQF